MSNKKDKIDPSARLLILRALHLQKTFFDPAKVEIFSDVTLTIAKGETVAITGASGEGKSTLLHLLGTLEQPTKGTIEIFGHKVNRQNASYIRNKYVGFVFQAFHLLEDYTTLENVLMPARIARKDTSVKSNSYRRALSLLAKVGLSDRANFQTKLLSGGEKQRVALARALCNNPDLILADEPTGNLDHQNAQHIRELLLDLAKDEGKSLILVTHDHEFAARCDRRLLLKGGNVFET